MTDFRAVLGRSVFLLSVVSLLGACAETETRVPFPDDRTKPVAEKTTYAQLPGWESDRHGAALRAFRRSCARWQAAKKPTPAVLDNAARLRDWRAVCREADRVDPNHHTAARRYFERRFEPHRIVGGDGTGLFTGYYVAELEGSWKRTERFDVPIYARPGDLIDVDLGRFSPDWKGERIAGRVERNKLVPYHSRRAIARGALADKGLELLWVDDAVDAFFLHVQGSGRVRMRDGQIVRVGYAARNGRPYVAIGKVLIERGAVPREKMSMRAIRDWLAAHPGEAADIMAANPSYIFFRRLDGTDAVGAAGVGLTPGRSLAVDRAFVPLGAPLWLVTRDPLDANVPLRRLVVAQDTGSAIKGPIRGDLFWGFGAEAAARAGAMKSRGRYYLLLPRRGCC